MEKLPCQLIEVRAGRDPWFEGPAREAKALCAPCPIRDACEEEGWRHPDGVWGGLTPADRRRMDPVRYAAAVANYQMESDAKDRAIIRARLAKYQGVTQ